MSHGLSWAMRCGRPAWHTSQLPWLLPSVNASPLLRCALTHNSRMPVQVLALWSKTLYPRTLGMRAALPSSLPVIVALGVLHPERVCPEAVLVASINLPHHVLGLPEAWLAADSPAQVLKWSCTHHGKDHTHHLQPYGYVQPQVHLGSTSTSH